MKEGVLQAPSRVPIGVPIIEDPPLPPGMSLDSVFRGQRMGDVFANTAPQTVIAPPAAPAIEKPAEAEPPVIKRYRPGGNIVAAVPIRRVEPVYPQIAIQARISGKVELEAVIGIDGRIHELRALSGPPLLIPAAVNAVKEWLYKPYLLNGDPIEVVQSIIVTFNLK